VIGPITSLVGADEGQGGDLHPFRNRTQVVREQRNGDGPLVWSKTSRAEFRLGLFRCGSQQLQQQQMAPGSDSGFD